jgi:hypothetical protein
VSDQFAEPVGEHIQGIPLRGAFRAVTKTGEGVTISGPDEQGMWAVRHLDGTSYAADNGTIVREFTITHDLMQPPTPDEDPIHPSHYHAGGSSAST